MSQYLTIPTIGRQLVLGVVNNDIFANRPVASGFWGYFYATDIVVLYYDYNGTWITIGGSGPGGFILNQTAVIQTAGFHISGIGNFDGPGAEVVIKNFSNATQLELLGSSSGSNNGAQMQFDVDTGTQDWFFGTGWGAGPRNMSLRDATNNKTVLEIAANTGNTAILGTVSERARSTPMGEWIQVTFAAGDFTAGGTMTWTVASGNLLSYQYTLVGKTMVFTVIENANAALGGVANPQINIKIPGGFTAAHASSSAFNYSENGATVVGVGLATVAASGTVVKLFKDVIGITNWALGGFNMFMQITLEIQ